MHARRTMHIPLARFGLMTFLLLLFAAERSEGAWTQTSGPKAGMVHSILGVPDGTGGARLFAGQIRVWRSDDRGANWTHVGNGLTDPNAFDLLSVPNGSGGNDILVGTNAGVFRTTDYGASWSPINNGLTNLSIYALAKGPNGSGGTNLYASAGTFSGTAFRSTDNGATWTSISSGLPTGQSVGKLFVTDVGTVLAGTSNGIYRSTNYGASWTRVFTLNGFSFAQNGSTVYAGTTSGVCRSTNDGVSWTAINSGMTYSWVYGLAAIPNGAGVTLFAGTGGVLRSTDNGATWTGVTNGLTSLTVHSLVTVPNGSGGMDLYAGTDEGVFRTTDLGGHWEQASFIYSGVRSVKATPSGAILAANENDIFRSTDGGATWTDTNQGYAQVDFTINLQGASGVSLFAGGSLGGIFKSTDDGVTWVEANNGINDLEVNSLAAVPNGSGGTNLLTGTYSGLQISTNDGGYWQVTNSNAMPLAYVVAPNGSGSQKIYGASFGGVIVSTDYGFTWSTAGLGATASGIAATNNGANVFAGVNASGVYRTTNGGATWTLVNNGLTDLAINTLLCPDGVHLFAGASGGVFLSSDNGDHWASVSDGLTTGVFSLTLSQDKSTLIAGTTSFGVWKRPLSEMVSTTGVHPEQASRNVQLRVSPNPFRAGRASISVNLAQDGRAKLTAFDVSGRRVASWDMSGTPNASQIIHWDGRSESGMGLAPGLYFFHLVTSEGSSTQRLLKVR